MSASSITEEIAAAAARLVVEEGMEYGPAKRRAARAVGRSSTRSADLPGNDELEEAVRDYIALFCADTQPTELAELRAIAARWMERLAPFRPYLSGAVWRGTATRLSSIHLDLYCDDSKAAELALIDRRVDYDIGSTPGPRGASVDVLSIAEPSAAFGEPVTLYLHVLDHDDLRGALKPDGTGRTLRGDLASLQALMREAER